MSPEPDRDLDKTTPPRSSPRKRDTTSFAHPPQPPTAVDGGDETRAIPTEHLPQLGSFVIEEKIGEGGMGVVYRAFDPDLQRRVAIKKVHPKYVGDQDLSERFVVEARSIAAVTHPNIAQIYSIHASDAEAPAYFVMEYVEGESAEKRVDRDGALPVEDAIDIALQAARGLRAAHRNRIVHRDVKPSNLVLSTRGLVKLVDFGLSKPVGQPTPQTEYGVVLGTPHYVSPEQARGWTVDHRADIYSLGCTLYFLLTARAPFEGRDRVELLIAHTQEMPEPVSRHHPELPRVLDEVLAKMLAKKPEDRYQDHDEVIAALRRVLNVVAPPTAEQPPRSWRSVALVLPAAAVLVFGMLAVWENYLRRDPPFDPARALGGSYTAAAAGDPYERLEYRFGDVDRLPPGIDAQSRNAVDATDSRPFELLGDDLRWKNFPNPLSFPYLLEFAEIELSGLRFTGRTDFELRIGYDPGAPIQYLRITFGVGSKNLRTDRVVTYYRGGEEFPVDLGKQPVDFSIERHASYDLSLRRLPADASEDRYRLLLVRTLPNKPSSPILELEFAVPSGIVGPGRPTVRCVGPWDKWSAFLSRVFIRGRLDRNRIQAEMR